MVNCPLVTFAGKVDFWPWPWSSTTKSIQFSLYPAHQSYNLAKLHKQFVLVRVHKTFYRHTVSPKIECLCVSVANRKRRKKVLGKPTCGKKWTELLHDMIENRTYVQLKDTSSDRKAENQSLSWNYWKQQKTKKAINQQDKCRTYYDNSI